MFQLLRIRVWEEVWHRHLFQDSTDNFILHIASNSYIGARKMFNRKNYFLGAFFSFVLTNNWYASWSSLGSTFELGIEAFKEQWIKYLHSNVWVVTCANFLTNFSWISWGSSSSAFAPEGSPITIFAWQHIFTAYINIVQELTFAKSIVGLYLAIFHFSFGAASAIFV